MRSRIKTHIKTLWLISVSSLILFLGGCASTYEIYTPAPDAPPFTPGRIAVIGGFKNEETIELSRRITEYLSQNSDFTVVTQEEISAVFPSYPANILDGSGFTENDKLKMDKIGRGIGADYLLVLWLDNFSSYSSSQTIGKRFHVDIYTRMLSYPDSREVGSSAFGYNAGKMFQRSDEAMDEMWSGITRELVDKILLETSGQG